MDYDIQWYPPGSNNVGKGYIGIQCPYCDDHSNHGGFNIEKEYYSCHRCKGHWMPKVITTLVFQGRNERISFDQAKKIIKEYSSGESYSDPKPKENIKYASEVIFPPGTGALNERSKEYLIQRNFDPNKLASEWGLLSTGHLGSYKFRILAPIYFNSQLVSYQCRDYTGKHPVPYMGCEIEESVYNLKHMLYGFDVAVVKRKAVVVEGISDAWRLGPGAVATFSMNFMPQQVLLLAKHFDKIFIMYDEETEADRNQADKLYHQLTIGYDKDVEVLSLDSGDPGDLSNKDAKYYMREIGL